MGLAASQGRYLCLTARNNDLIYEGQQISQQRLNLAKETQEVSDKYNAAMSNTLMQATTPEGGNQLLTYEILTSQDPFSGLCMRLVDLDGHVVVPKQGKSVDVTRPNDDGIDYTINVRSADEFISKFLSDVDGDTLVELKAKNLEELTQYYTETHPNSNVKFELRNNVNTNLKKEDERFLEDDNCLDPKYLQEMLTSGQWLIEQATVSEKGWESIDWQGSTAISQVYDESDDAAAEAEYESDMKELEKRDKILELRLEQVQTEQSAVQTELDSIKQVISKNVEDSFGTFA